MPLDYAFKDNRAFCKYICPITVFLKPIAKSAIEMDRPDMTEQYQQMARIKPSNLLEGETPHLIDEWQIATNIWNAVRYN